MSHHYRLISTKYSRVKELGYICFLHLIILLWRLSPMIGEFPYLLLFKQKCMHLKSVFVLQFGTNFIALTQFPTILCWTSRADRGPMLRLKCLAKAIYRFYLFGLYCQIVCSSQGSSETAPKHATVNYWLKSGILNHGQLQINCYPLWTSVHDSSLFSLDSNEVIQVFCVTFKCFAPMRIHF